MTALATISPLNQYFDATGAPLDGGELFFGIANGNPVTAPKVVYWDAAATQPASQPIQLLNGTPARNGTPAQVFVDGDYSLLVQDRTGSQVFYARTSADFGNAAALSARFDDLASFTDGDLGAGMVGFDPLLTYPENTVGAALASGTSGGTLSEDLNDPTKGGRLVAYRRTTGTGTALRNVQTKLDDGPTTYDFLTAAQRADVESGAATIDVTAEMQGFIDECEWRSGTWMPGKYRISSPIEFDPSISYRIAGTVFDINTAKGATILNTGNSPALRINNDTLGNFNPDIEIAHIGITGTNAGTDQHGIYARRTPVKLRSFYAVNCQHGIWLELGFTSYLQQCITANNFQNGVFLDKQCNQVTMLHCISNANARAPGGYAGFDIRGTLSNENLGVTMIGCDSTSNGAVSGSGSGILVVHSRSVSILGHYSEANKTFGAYADITAKSLTITGGYWQDEENSFIDVESLHYLQNNHLGNVSGLAKLRIQAAAGRDCYVRGNTYGGAFGVAKIFSNGAGERREQFNTGTPTVVGPSNWVNGDIIWHSSPSAGGNVGWVCVGGGAIGSWKAFGTIAA